MSETYVLEHEAAILGFVLMLDDYLAAIFIDVNHQSEGYGKELLQFIKRKREKIELKVYKKNNKAICFYLKNDFVIKERLVDEQTAEEEFVMEWTKY